MFDFLYSNLSVPFAGAIARAVRTAVGIVMTAVILGLADGSLLGAIHLIPQGYLPLLTAVLSPVVLAIDKYLRAKGLEQDDPENPAPPQQVPGP